MNAAYLIQPTPHSEAIDLIAGKPSITRDIFDQLPQELKGRAFTISGIEAFDVLQSVKDEITKLPDGADWKALRQSIADKISPWLGDDAAEARAKLLLNHHGRASYAAMNARLVHSQRDVFTHLQYRSSRISKEPRESHRALDGMIFPIDHPFWETHTPPWEFGCNCLDPIPLTGEDVDEERKRDEKRGDNTRRVASPEQLAALDRGTLARGPGIVHDVRTPLEKSGGAGGYEWNWRDTTMPYDQIRKRWDDDVASAFEQWAGTIEIEPGLSLLSQLTGQAPKSSTPPSYRAANFSTALRELGLDAKDAWTREDVANLRAAMRKNNPLPASKAIKSIRGARSAGALTSAEIQRGVQDLLDIMPRELAETLPPLQIQVVDRLRGAAGDYARGGRIRISVSAYRGLTGAARRREMRRTLSHELMHWAHLDSRGKAAIEYRAAIRSHYATRTAGDVLETHRIGYRYRRDKWWDNYAGAEYDHERGRPAGLEVPTRHYELWEKPEVIMSLADANKPGSAEFRETFALVHSLFDNP